MEDLEVDSFLVSEGEAGQRLDKILTQRYQEEKSRTYFQYLIEEQKVLLNGLPVKKRITPKPGDEIEIIFIYPPQLSLEPESIPLDIIFEDENIIIVNKPAGMVVHPAVGNWSGTFVNALLYHCTEIKKLVDNAPSKDVAIRPGIVHRLDKDTTGLLVAAKNPLALERLASLFAKREIEKEYQVITVGNPGNKTIDLPIGRHPKCYKQMAVLPNGGKKAVTHCKTLGYNGKLAVASILLVTGRTHQIRVHLQSQGTPVLGDPAYGNLKVNQNYNVKRQMLHAYRLAFVHPFTGKALEFKAPIPDEMALIAKNIFLVE